MLRSDVVFISHAPGFICAEVMHAILFRARLGSLQQAIHDGPAFHSIKKFGTTL